MEKLMSFLNLQYQADVDPAGPQNIKKGKIYINSTMVHDGFKQYTDQFWDDIYEDFEINSPLTELKISDRFACSSPEVLNSVFDSLGQSIDEE